MAALAEQVQPGVRVLKAPRFGGMGRARIGTVLSQPYQQHRGFWFVRVLWDDSAAVESCYLGRLEVLHP